MIVIGADTHMRSHTVAAVSEATGRVLATKTVSTRAKSVEELLLWARRLDDSDRVWALEDCRHVSSVLERFLLGHGERVVRVPPKLSSKERKASGVSGKSKDIDATAIAHAALRKGLENLPVAQLAGPKLDVRLLVDHRERLLGQRTALINELRWHLHALWPELEIPARALIGVRWQQQIAGRLQRAERTVRVRIAWDMLRRVRDLSRSVDALEREIGQLVTQLAPRLVAEQGCGVLIAAKLIGEIAGIDRFATHSKLARAAGLAPIEASSGRTKRHRLDRGGNRQLNATLHRLAITKSRCDPETAAYLARKQSEGKSRREALRSRKRHLACRIWTLLQSPQRTAADYTDARPHSPGRTVHCNVPSGAFAIG